jgi:uncharacterized protein (TIGR01440 family)
MVDKMYRDEEHTNTNINQIKVETRQTIEELLDIANLKAGDLFVVGGSSSEVRGGEIGHASSAEVGEAILEVVYHILREKQIVLAVQCCEHLNRALVVPENYAEKKDLTQVNAIPKPHAGGSFAVAYWNLLEKPTLVESVKAKAGLDIGDSFIGMHLVPVVVPVRLKINSIGYAHVTAARCRMKKIGGERAIYRED